MKGDSDLVVVVVLLCVTLPETNIAHENHHLSWQIPSKWWIFHGYVSLQEGIQQPFPNCLLFVLFLLH